jgi:hypothetical protein
MIAVYGSCCGWLPLKPAIATVTVWVLSVVSRLAIRCRLVKLFVGSADPLSGRDSNQAAR